MVKVTKDGVEIPQEFADAAEARMKREEKNEDGEYDPEKLPPAYIMTDEYVWAHSSCFEGFSRREESP